MKPTLNQKSKLGQTQAALLDAAVNGSDTELLAAAERYRMASWEATSRRAMRKMADALRGIVKAMRVRTELADVGIEMKITRHTEGFTPALRKRIREAGGDYTVCRGLDSTRYINIPASKIALADEVFENCGALCIIVRSNNTVWDALSKARGDQYPLRDIVYNSAGLQPPSYYIDAFSSMIEKTIEEGIADR